jgi:hypothetical protein
MQRDLSKILEKSQEEPGVHRDLEDIQKDLEEVEEGFGWER